MNKKLSIIIFLITFCFSINVKAQDFLKSTDLSTVKVDYLSETDILKIKTQLNTNKVSIEQAEKMALSKGMSQTEFTKLKNRIGPLETNSPIQNTGNAENTEKNPKEKVGNRKQEKVVNTKVKDTLNSLIFGSELFDNPDLNFEPNLKMATPVNYILGPGDELQISVYGVQEFNANLPVTVDGKVNIQYVGQIYVSGMTIESATQKIRNAFSKIYSTIASGQSQLSVSLSGIRTIRVTVIGGKQPGNYSISSLSSVFNAMFLAGGPGKNGSYRNIELIRNNKVLKNIDIYRFLVNGDQSDNIGLKDNDVIRIPAYNHRVSVEGYVKRAGIFEMKKGETFSDLLKYASGFNELAYTASVNVLQKTGKEFKVQDIKSSEFNSYQPLSGDVFRVSKIINRFENRIKINGAVFRPDTYAFTKGMRVSDLIDLAEGLKEDAYTNRAIIVRQKDDLTTEVVTVDLKKVIIKDIDANVELKKEDIVTIYSILDFKEDYKVTIDGEIKTPGTYDFYENLTLNDLIIQSGGLTESASTRVEIARMIKEDKENANNTRKVDLINIEIDSNNNEQTKKFELKPFDVINIRKIAQYKKPESIEITGAVAYPGKYILSDKKEKVSDIVYRAGGLTLLANPNGIKIKRIISEKQIEEIENVNINEKDSIKNKVASQLKDNFKFSTIPVYWNKILKNQKNNSNIILLSGDKIEVESFSESVKVTGNVLLNSEIPFQSGRGLNYYLSSVGGINNKGSKSKTYIIYPNGKASTSSSFLFFRDFPKITPGSQIVVPEKTYRKNLTTGEIVSIGGVLISITGILVTILRK